jgi:cation diffusion facilitator family transporter
MTEPNQLRRGLQSAQMGILVNALLAMIKLVAGIAGNAYALVADAVESAADILSSLIVLVGLQIAGREPTENYPFGYGRAESLAAGVVALMLIGTAAGISIEAVREIRTPHHAPAAWTLGVLVTVIVVKWLVSRRVHDAGEELGSRSLQADAWHHLSDALTSAAAFIGISVAVVMGPGWEAADDWAALAASAVILINGVGFLRGSLRDLMDRAPESEMVAQVRTTAEGVPGVKAVEKLAVRRSGINYFVDIHVQAEPTLPLREAHAIGGHVKATIRERIPSVAGVLVHLEPFEGEIRR